MDHPITPQSSVNDVPLSTGLTSDEARRRLEKFGPNAVPDTALHPLRRALTCSTSPCSPANQYPSKLGQVCKHMQGRWCGAAKPLRRLRRPARGTKFGRTAELVRTAHVESSQQKAVLRVVRNLAMFNGVIIVMLVGYAYALKLPLGEIIPLVLTAVLASIPVALPATFTLAAALGARALAHLGVLPTRLSAVDEAASIEVLCVDKTGTLTRNELKVTAVRPMPGLDESHVLGLAALASSDGGQDPVDAAIRSAASQAVASDLPKLSKFVPCWQKSSSFRSSSGAG